MLMKLKAQPNPHGRLLLTQTGLPLYRETTAKLKNHAIRSVIERAMKKTGVTIQLKQMRKFGITAVKRITKSDDSARMFAGQVIAGPLKFYARDDFAPVTVALKKWRKELRSSGVIGWGR
jgi:hypothetical protein